MKIKISYYRDSDNYHPEGDCVAKTKIDKELFLEHGPNFTSARVQLLENIKKTFQERKENRSDTPPPDEEIEIEL